MTPSGAVLLDRDGTVMDDGDYLADPAGVRLLDGAGPALAAVHAAGHRVLLVSNQSGVGRGYFDEDALWAVDAELRRQLTDHGAVIDGSYYCLHAPTDGCACRKPAPGLLERALAEHGVAPGDAVMVGDRPSDLAAGAAAGVEAHSITDTTWPDLVEVILAALPSASSPAASSLPLSPAASAASSLRPRGQQAS